MRNLEETSRRIKVGLFNNCWILVPVAIGAIGLTVVASFYFFSWRIKEIVGSTTTGAVDMALSLVAGKLKPLAEANRSAFAVAGALRLTRSNAFFSRVLSQVAPKLFMAFTMQPFLAQISYAGLNGVAFSYYRADDGRTMALFTYSSAKWYSQAVDPVTGHLVGGSAVETTRPPQLPDVAQSLLKCKAGTYGSPGAGWARPGDRMLFFTAPIGDAAGVVSVAVAVDDVRRAIASVDLHGVKLYYAIGDGDERPSGYHSWCTASALGDADAQEDEMQLFSSERCTASAIDAPKFELLDVWPNFYKGACTNFDASGVQLGFRLLYRYNHTVIAFKEMAAAVILVVLAMAVVAMVACYLMVRILRQSMAQEAMLYANLVRQKEALQQAERKSMNKSNAFALASHDIRSALAAIAGLIDVSKPEAMMIPDVVQNLEQMEVCTRKLLGILNSILDISKVESGKMQLEQVEFNLADVLEESVDMINVVGINKGIEVMWDPCDFSVLKCGNVIGDCRRFKQILDNLLGNAMKFTQEGHVILRAWANKPIARSSISVPSKFVCPRSYSNFFRYLFKTRSNRPDQHTFNSIQNEPDSIEVYFEVDDTGIGIPKEKRDSVFENYVQVKEGHGGTGLGLGIVQSFVRLMGGEISIRDKEPSETGTCFGFNVLVKMSEMQEVHDIEQDTSTATVEMNNPNVRAAVFREVSVSSFKGAHCVLFVHGDETRRILQVWMEYLGVKIWMIPQVEFLISTLEKVRQIAASPARTASYSFDHETDRCFSSKDMVNQVLPITMKNSNSFKKASSGGHPFGILVVVDLSDRKYEDMYTEMVNLAEIKSQLPCKVVCLADLKTSSGDLRRFRQMCCDLVLRKPLHGSRLYALLRTLRELQGSSTSHLTLVDPDSAGTSLQELPKAGTSAEAAKLALDAKVEDDKPLTGMRVLLVEDTLMLQNIEKMMLSQLGATVDLAEDGSCAVHMFKQALEEANISEGNTASFPYDFVLMDCEMPVMNGYEATKSIREEESRYGIRIPIIALTAHAMEEDLQKTISAGMDLHLTKPIQRKSIVDAVRRVRKDQQN